MNSYNEYILKSIHLNEAKVVQDDAEYMHHFIDPDSKSIVISDDPRLIEIPDNIKLSNEVYISNCPNFERVGNNVKALIISVRNCPKFENVGDNFRAHVLDIITTSEISIGSNFNVEYLSITPYGFKRQTISKESYLKIIPSDAKIDHVYLNDKWLDWSEFTLQEANVTANIDGYNVPGVFGKMAPKRAITMFGMKPTKKSNKHFKSMKNESIYKKFMNEMHGELLAESKYSEIKDDPNVSPKKKVNLAIQELHKRIYEIERMVVKNAKLKTEMNQDNRMYWKSTKDKLLKLSERMNRISTLLKVLSS